MTLLLSLTLALLQTELVKNLDTEKFPNWYGIVEYSGDDITKVIPPVKIYGDSIF